MKSIMPCRREWVCVVAAVAGAALVLVGAPGQARAEVTAADATAPATAAATAASFSDFSALDLEALLSVEVDVGSGFKKRIEDIPAVVDVMNADRIAALGVRDLNELTLRLAGVTHERSSLYPMIQNLPSIRGGGVSDRILLLIDDHPQVDEMDEVYNPFSVPIDAIERVEFLRGPAAVLYGSSSMAGVLRVVLKRPAVSGAHGTVVVAPLDDSYEAVVQGAYARGDDADVSLLTTVQARQGDDTAIRVVGDFEGRTGGFPQQVSYVTHLSVFRAGRWSLRAHNHALQSRIMGLQPYLSFRTHAAKKQLHGGEVAYERAVGDWQLRARTAADIHVRDIDIGLFPPFALVRGRPAADNRTTLDFNGVVVEGAMTAARAADRYELLTGLHVRHLRTTQVRFTFDSDGAANVLSPDVDAAVQAWDANALLQAGVTLTDDLELLAGFRGNVYKAQVQNFSLLTTAESDPAATITPMGRAALVWRAAAVLTIKALWGRSFRLPTLLESFSSIGTIVAPNPTIDPERMDTFELSLDMRPTPQLFWRCNGFYNRDRHAIEFFDPVTAVGMFTNSGGFDAWGVETNFDWAPARWFNPFGSLVFNEGRHRLPDGSRVYMVEVPRLVANLGIVLRPLSDDQLTVTPFAWSRTGVYQQPGDAIAALTVAWMARSWLRLSLHGENLFNAPIYQPIYNARSAPPTHTWLRDGRSLRAGVSANF